MLVLSARQLLMIVVMLLFDSGGRNCDVLGGDRLGESLALTSASMSRRQRRARHRRRRRQHLLHFCGKLTSALVMIHADALTHHRNVARLERPGHWWDHAITSFSPLQWKENFRMSRETFSLLVEELREEIERMNTGYGCHSVEKRLGITIWRLATPNAYRCISQLFGVGKTTAWLITHDVCKAIKRTLLPRYIKFPEGEDLQKVKMGFTAMGMPQAVGRLTGPTFPSKPQRNAPMIITIVKGFTP